MAGFIAGPQGDPARIRQTASLIETLRDHYDGDRGAINHSIDELLHTWEGDSAAAFQMRWYGDGGTPAPAHALAQMTSGLGRFVAQLRDYADQLEHAQHDHWIQMAVLTAMTVVNVAQAGLDPATDAAEVGMAAVNTVSTGFDLADIGTLAVKGAFAGFTSDIAGQAGADIWDHFFESGFDATGNDAVRLFDPAELVVSTAAGGATAALVGAGARVLDNVRPARMAPTDPPPERISQADPSVGSFSRSTDSFGATLPSDQVITYGEFNPAKRPGAMTGAREARIIDKATGVTLRWQYETYDSVGNVRSVRPQWGSIRGPHYIVDADGNVLGWR